MTYKHFIGMLEKNCIETRTHEVKVKSLNYNKSMLLSEFKEKMEDDSLIDDIVEGDK